MENIYMYVQLEGMVNQQIVGILCAPTVFQL